jgi:hypothetical protein
MGDGAAKVFGSTIRAFCEQKTVIGLDSRPVARLCCAVNGVAGSLHQLARFLPLQRGVSTRPKTVSSSQIGGHSSPVLIALID